MPEVLYGAGGGTGAASLYSINTTTGAASLIGAIGFSAVNSIAFNPSGTLYGIVNAATPKLITINTATGAGTLVVNITPASVGIGFFAADMTFTAAGVLLAWNENGPPTDQIAVIDTVTGVFTQKTAASFTTPPEVGLAFSLSGTLYVKGANTFDTANPTTGATAFFSIVTAPFGTNLLGSLAFNAAGVAHSTGLIAGVTNLYTIEPLNHPTTSAQLIGSTGIATIDSLAFSPAPLPGTCSDGGDITILPDELDGETFTGRSISPRAWLTVAYDDQDRSYGLDAMNHPTRRIQGHVIRYGTISRQLSDRFSSYKMADWSLDIDNASRFMDTLETSAASEHWANREARIHLASPETIAAGGTVHTLMRGILRSNRSRGLRRTIGGTDILGSEFSDFNLEDTIPRRLIGDVFEDAPDEALTKVIPIAYGNLSDEAIAVTTVSTTATFDGSIEPVRSAFQYNLDDAGSLVGYIRTVVTVIVGGAESPVSNAAGTYRDFGRGVRTFWNMPAAADSFRIYVHDAPDAWSPMTGPNTGPNAPTFVRVKTHDNSTMDGTWTSGTIADFSIDFASATDGTDAINVTTAGVDTGHGKVAPTYIGKRTLSSVEYHRFLLCGHAVQDVHQLYIDGVSQNIDTNGGMAGSGGIWLIPGYAGWIAEFGDVNYEDADGERSVSLYGRVGSYGPDRAAGIAPESLAEGQEPSPYAPLAVNFCAIEDVGDGTGSTITNAARQVYHLIQQWVLQNYETGVWADDALSDDGVPWLNSLSFRTAEDIEVARVGTGGYQGAIYLDEPVTVREVLGRVLQNFDLRFGQNEHGQVIAMHLDDATDLSTVDTVTDVAEITEPTEMDPRLEELENRVIYDWGYRFSDQVFTHKGEMVEDALAIAANRDRAAVGDRRSLIYVADQATADDVAGRALAFGKYPPRYVEMVGTLHWKRIKLGDVITATDVDGLGVTGWDDRALWVLGITDELGDLETPPRVRLTCVDVQRYYDTYAVLGDDSTLLNWASESEANRAAYWFLCDDMTGLFADGSPGKELR